MASKDGSCTRRVTVYSSLKRLRLRRDEEGLLMGVYSVKVWLYCIAQGEFKVAKVVSLC